MAGTISSADSKSASSLELFIFNRIDIMTKNTHSPALNFPMLLISLAALSLWQYSATANEDLPLLDCVIEPSEIVDIGSATAGVLDQVNFDRGDMVSKSQVVARLESGTERATAELARVRASLETGVDMRRKSAEFFARNQRRSENLTSTQAISRQDLDQLETEAAIAKMQVRQETDNLRLAGLEHRRAQEALKRRTIRSPIEGVVVERYKSVGEYVEDKPVMRIAQLDPLHVETIVPVDHFGKIHIGMHAKVSPSIPGQTDHYAKVSRIDRVADAASGTFGVRLSLDNPNGDIATGVRCELSFSDQAGLSAQHAEQKRVKTAKAKDTKKKPPVKKETTAPAITVATARNTQTPPAAADPQLPLQCFQAGPMRQKSNADRAIDTLRDAGAVVELREAQGGYSQQFFVLSEKTESKIRAQELMAEFRAANITDIALLRRGPYAKHVSLGLFASKEKAERHAAKVSERGFNIKVSPRSQPKYWLEVSAFEQLNRDELQTIFAAEQSDEFNITPCSIMQAGVN